MRRWSRTLISTLLLLAAGSSMPAAQSPVGSVVLADLSWPEAEQALTEDAVVVLAVGNASKAHGPHLPLATDFLQAEHVKNEVARRTRVVVAPSVGYGYYPPFVEYPGSTSLPLSVARDLIADICRSYARNTRARRFYIVSHGLITKPVYDQAAAQLQAEGLLLRYTDWEAGKAAGVQAVRQQARGSHADEIETSMLLYIAPSQVDMRKALREDGAAPTPDGRMIGNRPEGTGVVSPSGVFGDATLATREKGRRITEGLIDAVVRDIAALRAAPLPSSEETDAWFTALVGEYESAPGDLIRVARAGDMLALERAGTPGVLLQRVSPRRFGLWTTEARFLEDPHGRVTHVIVSTAGRDVLARRVR